MECKPRLHLCSWHVPLPQVLVEGGGNRLVGVRKMGKMVGGNEVGYKRLSAV